MTQSAASLFRHRRKSSSRFRPRPPSVFALSPSPPVEGTSRSHQPARAVRAGHCSVAAQVSSAQPPLWYDALLLAAAICSAQAGWPIRSAGLSCDANIVAFFFNLPVCFPAMLLLPVGLLYCKYINCPCHKTARSGQHYSLGLGQCLAFWH
jgi:hypothetical protein